ARRLGWSKPFAFKTAEDVWREHLRTTEGRDCDMTGMTRERLEAESLQWPCRDAEDPGAARLYTDGRFETPDGRARFVPPGAFVLAEEPSDAFPTRMITGRLRDQWHTMTKTGRVPELRQHAPEPRAEIGPTDASRIGVAAGDLVEIASARGAFRIRADLTDTLAEGTIFVPIHGNEEFVPNLVVNRATTPQRDPHCGQPELKHAAVRLCRVELAGSGRVVIVGMGAAGMAVARRLRALRPERPIAVVGKEPRLLYDRVRLHEVIAGAADAAALQTHGADWYEARGIETFVGAEAVAIDPKSRSVRLADGRAILYDQLVLANGAAAAGPRVPGRDLAGVFTVRGLDEALAIRAAVASGGPIIVVGAGPLGVEVAAALGAAGADATLLTHGNHPLRRHLDAEAASIVVDALGDLGVRVVTRAEIDALRGEDRLDGLRLKDGRTLPARAAIFAIGVAYDRRLAETAGLRIGERVRVDAQLRASDPRIFAVGDAAEFEGAPTGLVSVAEAHGDVVARVLAGDDGAAYAPEPLITSLKLPNLEVRASGRPDAGPSDEEDEITYLDRRRRRYRKVVLRRGRIAGIVSVGPFSGFIELHRRMRSGLRVGDARDELLSGIWETRGAASAGPTICACMSVPAAALIAAIASGARTVEELGAATMAGKGCGSCRPELAALLRRMGESGPSPPPG
ncbi:MAG: FAD-dependent oxidoreductase, partial [Myxococcales bacterium]|nr:FAD-dependent oxidoreductase [Myxococcales bacterium]